jgi:hypothetical protein
MAYVKFGGPTNGLTMEERDIFLTTRFGLFGPTISYTTGIERFCVMVRQSSTMTQACRHEKVSVAANIFCDIGQRFYAGYFAERSDNNQQLPQQVFPVILERLAYGTEFWHFRCENFSLIDYLSAGHRLEKLTWNWKRDGF